MIKNKSTTICVIVAMLLIVGSIANADVTLVDSVDVKKIILYSPCTWQHPLNYSKPAETISSATLEIEAYGILPGWIHPVYLEGAYLGDLIEGPHMFATTYTTFPLDDYLTELMAGPVSIEVGCSSGGGEIFVRKSTLSVTYVPEKPWIYLQPAPFTLVVLPQKMVDTIPGQKCVFLVKVIDEGYGYGRDEAVNISVIDLNVPSDTVVTVVPPAIFPGQVAEVTVIPGKGAEDLNSLTIAISGDVPIPGKALDAIEQFLAIAISGDVPIPDDPNRPDIDPDEPVEDRTLTILIVAGREGLTRTQPVTVNVTQGQNEFAEQASDYRDRFVPMLAVIHPELGITGETEWRGTSIKQSMCEVNYYLFFSEQWEMGLRWHVTIPPHDFAEIYLRRRDTNLSSTHAFKIYSLDAHQRPQVVVLPQEGIWR